MPRKKKSVEENTSTKDSLVADLIEGTEFNFIKQSESVGNGSLSNKPKVETPIYALNDLLGGGLPLGAIVEVYGPSASGKSTIIYETLGNFQRQYSEGVSFIIDSETSTDDSRLRALGVDPMRSPRMGATTLEEGFEQIIKILKKMTDDTRYNEFPVFILWDTIAACPTRAQVKTGEMYGGGMAERARIIKSSLTNIFPLIEKQNVLLILLNQVMADIGGWKPGLTSGGGNALKHDVHLKISVTGGKTDYDGVYAITKNSHLSVEKSKISPIMSKIPILIDITKGGITDRSGSLLQWITEVNPSIFKQAAWWSVEDWALQKYKPYWTKFELTDKFRQKALYEYAKTDQNFVDFLQLIWLDLISARYTLQSEVCESLKSEIENRLNTNLGLTSEDFIVQEQETSETDEITEE